MPCVQAADLPDPTWPETWPRTADEIHVFDIQGDVLLKLVRHADEPEVESEASSVAEEARPQVEEIFDETPAASVDVPDAETPPSPRPSPPDEEPAPAAQEPDEDVQHDDASVHSDDSASSADILTDVHMRVSSKHLILASPTFRSMLGPNFEEGQRLRIEGSTDIALGDDDPDAFEILLNIIHGLTRRVPRTVSLDMLTKLAILVNYYQMHEVVELFSDTWIDNLAGEGLPLSYCPEAISWLLITWVFHKPLEFREVSRVIELGCNETLEDDFDESLPIPPPVLGM
jgi:BTB/POZ domain